MKADVVLSIAIIAVTTIDHFADSHNHMFMTAVRWSSKEVALPGRKTVKKRHTRHFYGNDNGDE